MGKLFIYRELLAFDTSENLCNMNQQKLSSFIWSVTDLLRGYYKQAEQAIELLQERRKALISAAVTGKIDVRKYAAQETA